MQILRGVHQRAQVVTQNQHKVKLGFISILAILLTLPRQSGGHLWLQAACSTEDSRSIKVLRSKCLGRDQSA